MKTLSRIETYNASPLEVFNTVDDLSVTGMHMAKSSVMMMGSKLDLEYLTANHTGPGSKYRWTGKMLGMKMNFTVEVTEWIEGEEKIWETVGDAKLIILSWYRMHLKLYPAPHKTHAQLSITYERPKSLFNKILSFFFADGYCKWCLKKMLSDAKHQLIAHYHNELVAK